eukprot:GFUD01014081.1.p1 GENE.GFUD01014081.1~~GFUD01014081.1.p1  ORF type:complete len:592 (+),score=206.60 GFUD01014081.1:58-1833(+)
MSTKALFRQLTAGITFDTKKFSDDATKFGLIKKSEEKTQSDVKKVELPCLEKIKKEVKENIKKENIKENRSDSEDEITVFGNIKTSEKKKPKKKKKTKAKVKEAYTEQLNQFRNAHNIHTNGTDIPEPVDNWSKLKEKFSVSEKVVSNIPYTSPTPIQMQTIPLMLEGREVLACAPTGSGKTAAFLLPIIHSLKEPRNGGYRAVVVVPTKELAVQICNECSSLCRETGLRPHTLGKVKGDKPSSVKHDILITPPNRLVYLLNHDPPLVSLEKVEWLVIDEADKLFEAGVSGFREQLATVYKACSGPSIRRAMFSATLGPEVENWCRLNLDNLVKVRVGAANSATSTIDQKLLYCGSESGKLVAFRDLVRTGLQPPVLVFVQTKERAGELFKELLYDGIHVDVIHSERSEQQRENTVRAFRSGGIWVLICTELMGRGIDFKGVNLVINYDFPPSAVSYIHRVGRTGRAGRDGQAITFFTEEDRTILRTIAQVMRNSGCYVPEYMLHMKKPSRDDRKQLVARAPKRDGITKESKYEKEERGKKEEMIAASRKRKQEAMGVSDLHTDKVVKSNNTDQPVKKKKKKSKIISENNE